MKALYFDCSMGAAGDMLTAALMELYPEKEKFLAEMNRVFDGKAVVSAAPDTKCGVTGTHVTVTIDGDEENEGAQYHDHHRHTDIGEVMRFIESVPLPEKVRHDAAEVYKMRLPNKTAQTERVPYLLLQYIKSTDTQEPGQDPESECTVRIVAATYSEDESEGAMCVLNLLTRIRVALLKDGVVGGQFVLKSPLEMIVYPDSTAPYYLGEMMTTWTMPIIESEVQQIWQ